MNSDEHLSRTARLLAFVRPQVQEVYPEPPVEPVKTAVLEFDAPTQNGRQTATQKICVGDMVTFTHNIDFTFAGQTFSIPLQYNIRFVE